MSSHTIYIAGSVAVLAVLATALMKGITPGARWMLGAVRGMLLRLLTRGLGLTPAAQTAQAHAVMIGRLHGRELRMQLGAGRLHIELRSENDLGDAPLELAEMCVRARARGRLPSEDLEFGASALMIQLPLGPALNRERMLETLHALFEVLERVERDLRPDQLARAAVNSRLPGRLRARFLEYRARAFEDAPGTTELLVAAREDASPDVRIMAARLSGSSAEHTLLRLVSEAGLLPGRTQRALVDALLELRPLGLETSLSSIASCARAKTLLRLISAIGGAPEALPVLCTILRRSGSNGENGIAARRAALWALKEDHPVESWKDVAIEILSHAREPATLRQEAFEALVEAGCRRPALECMRVVATGRSPMRAFAIAALARHRGAREADWLIELARRDTSARWPLLLAFSDLQGRGEDWLIECLSSSSRLVTEQSLQHLETVGTLRALPPLRSLRAELSAIVPPDRARVARVDECIELITRRYRGTLGLGGGLSVASAREQEGSLTLSAPAGSVSKADRAT